MAKIFKHRTDVPYFDINIEVGKGFFYGAGVALHIAGVGFFLFLVE